MLTIVVFFLFFFSFFFFFFNDPPPTEIYTFPYTTLFRSRILAELVPQEPEVHGLVALMSLQASRDEAVQDRKSTRLNSSHTVISYAVFCLKKKKKKKITNNTKFKINVQRESHHNKQTPIN